MRYTTLSNLDATSESGSDHFQYPLYPSQVHSEFGAYPRNIPWMRETCTYACTHLHLHHSFTPDI